jgi:tRNA1(Val) A37 N6-methylase TrmN6
MRLLGQARGGFFPCPPEAVELAASMLRVPANEPVALLDPCCGEGAAIKQLAEYLGVPMESVWAVEVDEGRAEKVKANLPGANVVAPASFLTTAATAGSFSFIFCNPPFDWDEQQSGGRVEATFLRRATMWLRTGGILQLVCPEHVSNRPEIIDLFLQWFDRITVNEFPAAHREYQEVIVTAVKRSKPRTSSGRYWHEDAKRELQVYELPPSAGPKRFEKAGLTEAELARAVRSSPLRKHLETPVELPVSEPPLPLATGHIALLLASGKLDGPVFPKNEPAHIVRGVATKVKYQSDQTVTDTADGGSKTTTVYSEKITLTIRAVGADGEIRTFGE